MNQELGKLFTEVEIDSLYSENPTPLYYRIYTLLKSRILNGTIADGDQMPTEHQLATVFDVSRITAKRAMDELAAQGLIIRRRGKGSHVTHQCGLNNESELGAEEKLSNMSLGTKVRMLDTGVLLAPVNIAAELGLEPGGEAHRVVRLRCSKDDRPFAYSISWTLGQYEVFNRNNLESRARYDIMEEAGIRVAKIEQQLTATAADEEVARELDLCAGDPILTLVRHSYLTDGTLIDIMYSHFNPERYHYCTSFSLDDFRGKSA